MLRRDIDRMESLVMLLAMALFLCIVPLALLLGSQQKQSGAAAIASQPVEHQITATLVRNAPVQANSLHTGNAVVTAQGRWRTPSGVVRTGDVGAYSGQPAGSTVGIWVDAAGNQVPAPLTAADVDRGALLTVIALLGCVLIGIGCALWGLRMRLNRRRYAAWEHDWLATEPRWTRRG